MPTIFALFFLGILNVPLATALSFDFPSFNQSSLSNITFVDDASWSSGHIQLTKNQITDDMQSSLGRAVYVDPLLLWNNEDNLTDFSTHFAFIINPNGQEHPGDGMAFFLSPFPSNIPNNTGGCGLGVFNVSVCMYGTDSNFSEPIVAVEFDTFPNIYDPGNPHVGIDVGSTRSVVYQIWEDDGNGNGSKWQGEAWVSYDSGTHNLSVFLTLEHGNRTTNYSLSYIVDLRKVLNSSEEEAGEQSPSLEEPIESEREKEGLERRTGCPSRLLRYSSQFRMMPSIKKMNHAEHNEDKCRLVDLAKKIGRLDSTRKTGWLDQVTKTSMLDVLLCQEDWLARPGLEDWQVRCSALPGRLVSSTRPGRLAGQVIDSARKTGWLDLAESLAGRMLRSIRKTG
ncbi:hypothetical protein ZIOFF_029354 [Zingiber officinale]|uniref:Legume lectin domain-containing protein n=1 Tax=Zingiber officinale TaxID=94328 RepID=A0A8J5GPF0_ZINOF|nr:hypothetical protein ZIOFF_029354 [Zingiber officinale]